MLSLPSDASKRLRGAMRCGFLSLSPVLGAGMLMRLEENSDAGQTAGRGLVGVTDWPLHVKPAWNSSSAVSGRAKASTIAIAGCPLSIVDVAPQGVLGSTEVGP